MRISVKLYATVILITIMAFTAQPKLVVSSTAFSNNGNIPSKYSCEGAQFSPPLSITNIPSGTKSLAITVHDPDAHHSGGVTHWVIWNLPIDGNVTENFTGGKQGFNSDHKTGYKAVCPQSGTHHYNFKVYALDTTLQLDTSTDKAALETAMHGHILAQGELTGLYTKINQ